MAFVESRTLLADRIVVPPDLLTPVCGDILDLGNYPATGRALWMGDLWLVVNAYEVFQAAAGSPLLAMGITTTTSVPTAAALTTGADRIWQYGNVDISGVVPFGFAAGADTIGQLLVTRLNRVKGITINRYLGFWLQQACPDATGTFEGGTVTAYLTTSPPSGDILFPDGI
jgi:hypothetical protein